MDASREEENQLIRAVLVDFFHSLFPKPSQFELPADYRNRFLYYDDFVAWQTQRSRISLTIYTTVAIVITAIFGCLFYSECLRLKHRSRRRLLKLLPDSIAKRGKLLNYRV